MRLSLILCVVALMGGLVFAAIQTLPASQNPEAAAEAEALTAQLAQARADMETESTALSQQISELEAQTTSQADEIAALLAEKEEFTQRLETDGAGTAELNATIAALQAEQDALNGQIATLENEAAAYVAAIAALENDAATNQGTPDEQVAALETVVAEQEAALAAAQEQIASLSEGSDGQGDVVSAMSGEITTLEAEVAGLTAEITDRDATIAALQSTAITPVVTAALSCQQRSDALLDGTAITFENGTAAFAADTIPVLEGLAALASECAQDDVRLDIEGHTSDVGGLASNLLLSNSRAQAVYDFFATNGVPASAMRSVGFGGSAPIADNATSEGQLQNQRIVLYWK